MVFSKLRKSEDEDKQERFATSQIKLTNLNQQTQYFKLVYNRKNFHMISKADFKNLEYPCVTFKEYKIKYYGCTRKCALEFCNRVFSTWIPQGILGDISEMFTTLKESLHFLNNIKNASKVIDWDDFLVQSIELALCMYTAIKNGDWTSGVAMAYKIYNYVHLLGSCAREVFKPQGMEEITMSFVSSFFPKPFQNLIKHMQSVTSTRLLDDPAVLQTIFNTLAEILEYAYSKVEGVLPEFLVNFFRDLKDLSGKYAYVRDVSNILKEFDKNPKLIIDPVFTMRTEQIYAKCLDSIALVEYSRRSNYVKVLMDKLDNLIKQLRSHKEVARAEPNAFILEGPPGCGKSTLLTKLISVFDMPSYSHIVKPTEDTKDFYDTYNGEKIFYMDDVGQMSASQWRTLIFVVSCAKMPLACADAKLKNTKYFSSDIVLCTTNNFMHLQNLAKSDCISDIHALKRRGYVFDMSDMKYINGEYSGSISFKFYDMRAKAFVEGFPTNFLKFLQERKNELPVKLNNPSEDEMIGWCYAIIMNYDTMKAQFKNNNALDGNRKETIRNLYFKPQSVDTDTEYDSDYEDSLLIPPSIPTSQKFFREAFLLAELEPQIELPFSTYVRSLKVEDEPTGKVDKVWYELLKDLANQGLSYIKKSIRLNFDVCKALVGGAFLSVIPFILYKFLTKTIKSEKPSTDVMKPQSVETVEAIKQVLPAFSQNAHSLSNLISNQVLHTELQNKEGVVFKTLALYSGHYVILPCHNTLGSDVGFLSSYTTDGAGCVYDNVSYTVVFRNFGEDVAVLELPLNMPTYFKNLKSSFRNKVDKVSSVTMCALGHVSVVKRSERLASSTPVVYTNSRYNQSFFPENIFPYDFQQNGLCGAVITDNMGNFLGMHVAGSPKDNVGVSVLWSNEVRDIVSNLLENDVKFFSKYEIKKPIGESGFKINKKEYQHTSNKSSLVESPLYGVLPVTRQPAKLDVDGPHTIKTMATKSFKKSKLIDNNAYDFAKRALATYIAPFDDLSELEVVKGNDTLAGLNKDSSNGYGCKKEKEYYVDFTNGALTPICRQELETLEEDIVNGVYNDEDWFWTEAIKDELRNDGKHLKPRTFRVARIHTQLLMKRIFGNMVSHIMENRNSNEIMIGVNPFVEWDNIYARLQKAKGVWAGDIGSYDGNMLPQVQKALHDVLLEKYTGRSKELCSFLLMDMMSTSVVVNDDVWRTTHSMPSGSYLTAIGNSLVNRFYTLMWYYQNVEKPSLLDYQNEVIDYVYGDDKLNGLKSEKYKDQLNAMTMETFFHSLGMTFTTASKEKIVAPFEDLKDVSFLKRHFRYHPLIKKVMCPLELRTLESGLSWLDSKKDVDVVLDGKLSTFQREMFLQDYELYLEYLNIVKNFCLQRNIPFVELTKEYMLEVYANEADYLKTVSWCGSRYL